MRHVTTFGLALVIGSALAAGGCSQSYQGERLFWKAQQVAKGIDDPSKATPEQVGAARRAFQRVIEEAPGSSSAARAQLAIASLYVMQRNYDQALEGYDLFLKNYSQFKDLALNARVAIAKTHEAQKHWDEAAKTYKDIAERYPWSPLGLQAPIYVGRMYEQQQKPEEARRAYERAASQYTKMMPEAPNVQLATQVKSNLALSYQRLGQWERASQLLEELATMGEVVNRPLVLLALAALYQTKMEQPERAKELYSTIVGEFPDHPFGEVARAQLQRMADPTAASAAPASAAPVPAAPVAPAPPAAGAGTASP